MTPQLLVRLILLLSAFCIGATDKLLTQVALDSTLPHVSAIVSQVDPSTSPTLRQLANKRKLFIGAATEAVPLLREPDFAKLTATQFNMLAAENRLKFNIVHPTRDTFDFKQGDAIVQFAQQHKMSVRGHCFIWHEMFPHWLLAPDVTSATAEAIVRDHIATLLRRYHGKILYWDVVNEPVADDGKMRESPWRKLLGEDYIERSFRWAREADPTAKLFLNDFGIETICPKSDTFYALTKRLLAAGVPLDGLGFQMHLNLGAGLSTTSLQQNLRRFAALGLELHVTEMDVSLDQTGVSPDALQRQGAMYKAVLQTTLQFPQFTSVVFWGAADRHSWLTQKPTPANAPLLFDNNLRPKPAYYAVAEVLGSQ